MDSCKFQRDLTSESIKLSNGGSVARVAGGDIDHDTFSFAYTDKIFPFFSDDADTVCNYVEIKVIDLGSVGVICFGFCDTTSYEPDETRALGWDTSSLAYHSDDGCIFQGQSFGQNGLPAWEAGDVIGVGMDLDNGQIFYTKNGSFLSVVFQIDFESSDFEDNITVVVCFKGKNGSVSIIDGVANKFLYDGLGGPSFRKMNSTLSNLPVTSNKGNSSAMKQSEMVESESNLPVSSTRGISSIMKHREVSVSENGYLATIRVNTNTDDYDEEEYSSGEHHRLFYLNSTFHRGIASKADASNYFEFEVMEAGNSGFFAIGFANPEKLPFSQTSRAIGWVEGSVGYHGDDGGCFLSSSDAEQYNWPAWTRGDTVGCGINFESWELFFTKNGVLLGHVPACDPAEETLQPVVAFEGSVGVVRINDGIKPFLYQKQKAKQALSNDMMDVAEAARKGSKAWGRSKIMIVGEGRAGKTALANGIIGRAFEETASTVGINQLTCDIKYAGVGDGEWGEFEKPEKELESALASIMIEERNRQLTNQRNPPIEKATQNKKQTPKSESNAGNKSRMNSQARKNHPSSTAESLSDSHAIIEERITAQPTVDAAPTVASITSSDFDQDIVMKCLAKGIQTETKLILPVFDYGGQSVFNVIHHFFLTQYGIYLLCFNMQWLVSSDPKTVEQALSYLRFWLNSVVVHTYNDETKTCAPVVFVGTRKDQIAEPAQHTAISTLIYESFHGNMAWPFVLEHREGIGHNGRTSLTFFPVNNTLGRDDPDMRRLLKVIEIKLLDASYVREEKPLTWLQTLDKFSAGQNSFLTYEEVTSVAISCNVPAAEVPILLRFLHEMGFLMWHEEEALRDTIILDAVNYFVAPITGIICKHAPTKNDPTHHLSELQEHCRKNAPHDWQAMTKKGLLSEKLLYMLLANFKDQCIVIKQLMVKFGLLVPLLAEADGMNETMICTGDELATQKMMISSQLPLHGDKSTHGSDSALYLVPALLPISSELNDGHALADRGNYWSDESYSTCYFLVSSSSEVLQYTTFTEDDLKQLGFLPRGLFERLIGKVVAWCQQSTLKINLHDQPLYQDLVILSLGSQRFRLQVCDAINCIQLDIEGKNPLVIYDFIESQIKKVMGECMKSLHLLPLLVHNLPDESLGASNALLSHMLLIPYKEVCRVIQNHSILQRRGGRKLLTSQEAFSLYGAWIHDRSLRDSYDIFISYRWGNDDSLFAQKLFDFSNYNVGDNHRAVDVFLDRERLQDGRQFQFDFAKGLFSSLIIVPILSYDSLERMVRHDPSKEDNLLIEWILALYCINCSKSRVCRIFPIAFGKRNEPVTKSLFASGIFESIPNVVPTSSLKVADQYLRRCGVEPSPSFLEQSLTNILSELKKFQLFPTWNSRNHSSLLPIECAQHIEKVLKNISPSDLVQSNVEPLQSVAANFSTAVSQPSSHAIPTKDRPLNQIVQDIKVQLGIEANGAPKILALAAEELLIDDATKQEQYKNLDSLIDKAKFLAQFLGVDVFS